MGTPFTFHQAERCDSKRLVDFVKDPLYSYISFTRPDSVKETPNGEVTEKEHRRGKFRYCRGLVTVPHHEIRPSGKGQGMMVGADRHRLLQCLRTIRFYHKPFPFFAASSTPATIIS